MHALVQQLSELPFVERIILFGSRARGDAEARSDIDLAIQASGISILQWQQVLDLIFNAETLLGIDCVHYDQLNLSSPLKKRIDLEGKILYVRDQNPAQC